MALGQLGVGFGRMGAVGGAGSSGADAVSALNAGFQSAYPLGTTGDWFVSKTGDNSDGTTPSKAFNTIAQAVTAASAGQTIRVIGDGAIYREAVDLTNKGGTSSSAVTKLLAYGADKPIISAAEELTSWTLCTSPTDDTELGATHAGNGKVWKKTGIAIADFVGSSPISANLYQNGVKMNIATAKSGRAMTPDIDLVSENWLTSPSGQTLSATFTITIASPGVVTQVGHKLAAGAKYTPTTTGALPTGLTAGTAYYVKTVLGADTFTLTASPGGAVINTTGSQSGTHTGTWTAIRYYVLPTELQSPGRTFTSGQFTDVFVLQHVYANLTAINTVSAYDSTANTVTMTTQAPGSGGNEYEAGAAFPDNFALQNFLPEMRQGEWGYRITGGGTTVTLYIWPHDDSLGTNMVIEYSKRGYGVKIGGATCTASLNSYVEIGGFIIERQSSAGSDTDGNNAISFGGAPTASGHRTDINIHDCWIRDTWRSTKAYGQIHGQNADNVTIQRCTLSKIINSYGIFLLGETWYDVQSNNIRILDNVLDEVTNSCLRLYSQKNVVIGRNRFKNSCLGDHSNQTNPYFISKDVVYYGNLFQGCTGYFTWADSNPPDILFNWIDGSHQKTTPSVWDARAAVDQNNNGRNGMTQGLSKADWITLKGGFVNPQAPPCYYENTPVEALIACNQMTPNGLTTSSVYRSLELGGHADYSTYFTYRVVNNVLNGITWDNGTAPNGDQWLAACLSNITTKGASSIAGITTVDASNRIGANSEEYTDIATNDWSAPVGAYRRTKSGLTMTSISSQIATLKTRFSDVASMFDYDAAGRTYTKTNPPAGPFTAVDDTPSYKPVFWQNPTLGGSVSSGLTSTVSVPLTSGYPKPTITYAWYLLTDYRNNSSPGSVLGTSTTSPTWAGGDIGKYPACKVTLTNSAGSTVGWAVNTSPINSGALISTPSNLSSITRRATGSSINTAQTINYSSNGLPIVVVIGDTGISSSVYINWTVTIDGTPMTQKSTTGMRNSNTQGSVFFLTGVSSGAHTITMTPDSNYFAFVAQAFEIGGALDITAGTAVAGNTTSLSPQVTPGDALGAVFHVGVRRVGDGKAGQANPIVTTEDPPITLDQSGTSAVSDITYVVSFEQWASGSACDSTITTASSPPTRQFCAQSFWCDGT